MAFCLRDYQLAGEVAAFEAWKSCASTLLIMPTGSGKTPLLASIIAKFQPLRACVVAHREELVFQARNEIMTSTGLECSIEMGELMASHNEFTRSPVIVATVQTLNSAAGDRTRMSRINPKDFGVLVIDEGHHAVGKTYRNVINYFKQNNPNIKILAVTATPDRFDEEALGQVFDTVAYEYTILEAIHDGWLVPVEQQMVIIEGLDITHCRSQGGDLNGRDLAAVMEQERNLQGVAGASIPIIGDSRSIVFTASVKQAENLCDIFNRHRSGMAGWVCGKTSKDTRNQLREDFKSGRLQVLCNCNVYTEGFNCPEAEMVIMASPTKSRSRYAQRAGRCMRPLPGVVDPHSTRAARKLAISLSAKPRCRLVDFCGDSGRHKLVCTADILGGNVSEGAARKAYETARKSAVPVLMTDLLKDEEEKIRKKLEAQRLADKARKEKLLAKVKYSTCDVNAFDVMDIHPVRRGAWDNVRVLSDKGQDFLVKQGFNPDDYTYSEALAIMRDCFRRFSGSYALPKQCAVVKRFYPEVNTHDLTRESASKLIQAVADNGWKRKQPTREALKP
jgi:superfamily II DNA or RNA helicase